MFFLIFVIALAVLALVAIIATIHQVSTGGYRPVATRSASDDWRR